MEISHLYDDAAPQHDPYVMTDSITLRDAEPNEADQISALALRSKAYWGYSQEFLDLCVDELTIHSNCIEADENEVVVAERNGEIAGFYSLARKSSAAFELHALFVEPEHIGSGVGRSLIQHALDTVNAKFGKRLLIQGDPNAERFYLAAGARQIGMRDSGSVPGRSLPLFEIVVGQSS